jgi:hypothetical protein
MKQRCKTAHPISGLVMYLFTFVEPSYYSLTSDVNRDGTGAVNSGLNMSEIILLSFFIVYRQ